MSSSTETAAPIPATRASRRQRHGKAKAILAIAAGTALLLGGGGTYAYWTTTTALTNTEITAGNLGLTLRQGSWTLKGALQSSAASVTDIANVRIVPGDVLTLTQNIDVTLVGDTLTADLKAELGSTFAAAGLGANLDVAMTVSTYGTPTAANTYRLTSANNGAAVAIVTITFKPGTGGQVGVGQKVNLSDVKFTLTQVGAAQN